ncbi:MAG TPA: UMP kinase [Candidatus Cloacimonas sp.]|jgi:uridylate kinase|nr:uridylate kinase [Candidatus Cloacimonadota bacterium]HCX73783.1 UMP kinase [Candidatus Cloacimonas sp.]
MERQYKPERINRIIFKISGEILAGKSKFGINMDKVDYLIEEILSVKKLGFSIGVVLGGGNIFRGASEIGDKLQRFTADNIGMLATVQNALILDDQLKQKNYRAEVFSAIQLDKVAKFYTPSRAETSLNEGKICFFCAGTGNPFFTTDTAAVLRAIELKADIVFKGTKVDGVYTADPQKDKTAKLLKNITYAETINKQLKVMDMTAFSLAREHNMPIKVFNVLKQGNFEKALLNDEVGTFVHE